MRHVLRLAALLALLPWAAQAADLAPGAKAPDFSLPGSDGGDGTAIDMSASEAKELATALTDAADAIGSS